MARLLKTNRGRRWLGAAVLSLVGACANDMPLDGRPDRVWASSRSLDNATACVIKALDDYRRMDTSLAPSISHASEATVPGKIYEIRPKQEYTVSTESYFVRLEKIDDRITRISLFSESPWRKDVIRTVSKCGESS